MSRSGYSEDLEEWALIRWRGAVASAIRGKRGQSFLREMEAALIALPEKKLIHGNLSSEGQVCSLGAVMLSRKIANGVPVEIALKEIEKWGDLDECGNDVANDLNIAGALAKEIMFENDDDFWNRDNVDEQRYNRILKWVQSEIRVEATP